MTELIHFYNDHDDTFVPTLKRSRDQLELENPIDASKSKMYILAYKLHALKYGIKLKRMTFNFVAPYITNGALQAAQFFNKGIKTVAGVEVYVHLWSVESFMNELISLIPNEKWFIKDNFIPSNCLSVSKVQQLVESNCAIIK